MRASELNRTPSAQKQQEGRKRSIFIFSRLFLAPLPYYLNAWNRLGKKLKKQQNNTAFAKLSYLVNNCKPVSVANSPNVVFVARFSNQIVCFSTKSWDRKRFKSFYGVMGNTCQVWSQMQMQMQHICELLIKHSVQQN